MADKKVTIEPTEPVYILPPHPEAHLVTNEQVVTVEEPIVVEKTLTDLVQSAVAGLRGELIAELQINRGGLLDAKNSKLPIG